MHRIPAFRTLLAPVVALIALLLVIPGATVEAQRGGGGGPIVVRGVKNHPLKKDLRRIPKQVRRQDKPFVIPNLPPAKKPKDLIPRREYEPRTTRAPKVPEPNDPPTIQNFDGMDRAGISSGFPPDPVGDIGLNHYVQAVNTNISIYDRFGNLIPDTTVHFNDFFSADGGTGTLCDTNNGGDPIVMYDQFADRWFISDIAFMRDANNNAIGPYFLCIAVSHTGDPVTDGWNRYAFQSPLYNGQDMLPDYPKYGVWPDGYYATTNQASGGSIHHARAWVFDRAAMLVGSAASFQAFDLSSYLFLLPSNAKGTPPLFGTPNYLGHVNNGCGDKFSIFKFHVDWGLPVFSTITGPTDVQVAGYCDGADTVHSPVDNPIETLSDRLMLDVKYRNYGTHEALFGVHAIDGDGFVTAMRYYEIRDPGGTPFMYTHGTYQPDTVSRFMGSIAANGAGDVALGYSVTCDANDWGDQTDCPSGVFPGLRYHGYLADDPVNSNFGSIDETSIIEGGGTQVAKDNNNNPIYRWGDYSSMSVDPLDDCTFWYTGEYYAATGGNWKTRIASIRFPSCAADVSVDKTDDPDPVIAGDDLTYQIKVSNAGPATAIKVGFNDVLPAQLDFKSISTPGGWTCNTPAVGSGGLVSCKKDTLDSGDTDTIVLVTTVDPATPDGDTITNSVFSFSQSTDSNSTNDSKEIDTSVIARADLDILKVASINGVAGAGSVSYDIFINNHGPSDAQNVTLSDLLDPTITQTNLLVTDNGVCGGDPQVDCTWTTIPAGENVYVQIKADLKPEALNLCNTATADSDTADSDSSNNSSEVCKVVPAKANLKLGQTAEIVNGDQSIRYTFKITNAGPSVARNVKLKDLLADATKFEFFESTAGTCKTGAQVVCNLGDIYPGVENTVKLQVKIVKAVDAVKNTGVLKSKTDDPKRNNNKATVKIPLGNSLESLPFRASILAMFTGAPPALDRIRFE